MTPHDHSFLLHVRSAGAARSNTLISTGRYKKAGSHFEIMCLPSFVELYREGKATRDEAAVGSEVFKDAKLGDRPSTTELEAAFGTGDHLECIDIILQKVGCARARG